MKKLDARLGYLEPLSRRDFLGIMGASLALGGLGACTRLPAEKIIPYVLPPDLERLVPGVAQYYASCFSLGGYAQGILVESHQGRPTQIQGNPEHPASLGGSSALMQASLLSLYDPARAQTVTRSGLLSHWDEFAAVWRQKMPDLLARQGEGLRILTGTVTSPTVAAQMHALRRVLPKVGFHAYEPLHLDEQKKAAHLSYGRDLWPLLHLENARVILSLDADFLGAGPQQLADARAFAGRRDPTSARNRLYVVESSMSLTGAAADHRWALPPSRIYPLAYALAQRLGVPGLAEVAEFKDGSTQAKLSEKIWLETVAEDLRAAGGASLITAGAHTPSALQALVYAMNEHLGNLGHTLDFVAISEASADRQETSLAELIVDMEKGRVDTLLMTGVNPVYAAPRGKGFAQALAKVPLRIHHSLYVEETSELCTWHLPEAHALEAWSDARAWDGTLSLGQPLISPLHESRSLSEVLALLAGRPAETSHSLLEANWRGHAVSFAEALQTGFLKGSGFARVRPTRLASWRAPLPLPTPGPGEPGAPSDHLEVSLRPDATIWDGTYAGNAWLQELPKPLLALTWSNAAVLSPATADRLGIQKDGEVITLDHGSRSLEAPVLRVPGHPENTVTLSPGYGRWRAGEVGNGHGYDLFAWLNQSVPGSFATVKVTRTNKKRDLALVHEHHSMEGRDLVRRGELGAFTRDAESIVPTAARTAPATLLPDLLSASPEAWGMVIDLSRCIGCNACVIACQAENNIPVVGEAQVRAGREMHWIRVDRYFADAGPPAGGSRTLFQPVPCMHCEAAPCEVVCPTGATNHSQDGLNQMVYNRCVGTRYCSNNCPYKVRRFNFFAYADADTTPARTPEPRNPDVTVRSRGVMEKCTYCVQRITEGRIAAEKENRPIRDGDIRTACQQACPTVAIHFGNIKDARSRVARLKASPLNYALLGELGTRPRTTYLAQISNPHPRLR